MATDGVSPDKLAALGTDYRRIGLPLFHQVLIVNPRAFVDANTIRVRLVFIDVVVFLFAPGHVGVGTHAYILACEGSRHCFLRGPHSVFLAGRALQIGRQYLQSARNLHYA
jgi:hypothetical protein